MKIVVLELGFEDDTNAEDFAKSVKEGHGDSVVLSQLTNADVIECRVENP